MSDPATTVDVLIVGAGPAGSTLAIDLLRRGVSVRIIERNAQAFPGSRAKGLQPRSLEVLEDLGAVDAALASGDLYPPLGIHLGPLTLPRRMYKIHKPSADVPYPNTWLIPQSATDGLLHARLKALGGVVEFGSTLKTFVQQPGGVRAVVESNGGTRTIDCHYMVGCDGGASTVRERLNIDFPGRTDESDRMIIVDCKTDGLSRNYWHAWPGKKGRFIVACPLPHTDLFQWMLRLEPGEEPDLSEAALNARVRRRAKGLRLHGIEWTSVFRPNIRLAARYREGRVFLAGDAAHVHTPAGAQGMNTGVQDAYNLGWKLGQVLKGVGPALLDTYEAERQPIAAGVLGLSTQKYEAMSRDDPSAHKRGKDEQQLLLTYRAGPLGRAARDGRLSVGDRAPDGRLQDASRTVRLFELFQGPHFTALAFGDAAARALQGFSWPKRGVALKRVVIGAPSVESSLRDRQGVAAKAYGLTGDGIVLVRPDGYVGEIAETDFPQALAAAAHRFAPAPT